MTGRQDIVVSDDQIQVVVNRQNSQRPQQLYRCTVTYNGSTFAMSILSHCWNMTGTEC